MIDMLTALQDAFAALYNSLFIILVLWVILICVGLVFWLWNSNSRLREENYDLRRRAVRAEAAIAFAYDLPSPEAKSDFILEYRLGYKIRATYSGWPEFLQARLSAALDNRS
ncbi:hypothetical protein GOZ97_07590 [Agrobacterium vitis]|uniref:hypothetical protein n=1 Tax=Agrobacterium vitis TaxID=373 RepID=UPI0008FB212A|nr:hypothetical protein [Agrobacterium vitis]MUZ53062.1 hypothetical protein [Agrobacterium vitis]MUZ91281.1 hypothetical protein [Agrobacterium vitis]MVA40275.1 hypothetical protein [Agrobacterium vitis]NSX96121.1 hypothetical protein [Agrobacterium vitis]NSZ27260.1 hypothetical protein [Agrobacterium vitis]